MKKINGFKTSWNKIDKVLHDMKNALTILNLAEYNFKSSMDKAKEKIGNGIEGIFEAINEIRNDKGGMNNE